MFLRTAVSSIAVAIFSMCVLSSEASASLQLRLEQSGFAPLVITDNDARDASTTVGVIVFSGSYGTFNVNTSVGISKPVLGNANTQAVLDLDSSDTSSTIGGILMITVVDTDFDFPANPIVMHQEVGGVLNAPPGSSISFQTWANANNPPMPAGTPSPSNPAGSIAMSIIGPFGPGPYMGTASGAFTRKASAYSFFTQATMNLTGAGHAGFNSASSATGNPVGQPSSTGRMTGGGSIFTLPGAIPGPGIRITHGFEIHCDASVLPNRLEINIHTPANDRFHLATLTSAVCTDDPSISPGNPAAGFDTFVGTGIGSFNGADGYTINFTFTDAGEPGTSDIAKYLVWLDSNGNGIVDNGEVPVLESDPPIALTFGNHQAHGGNDNPVVLGAWQTYSDTRSYPDYWPPSGFAPSNQLKGVFSRVSAAPYKSLGNNTLLQALAFSDGSTLLGASQTLLRVATAALLDASHPYVGYAYTPQDLQNLVNAALDSQDQAAIMQLAFNLLSLDVFQDWQIPPVQSNKKK